MKSLKKITLGACAVLAFAGVASAATTVYITGSSAFRGETTKAIFSLLGSSNPTASNPTLPSGGYAFSNDAATPGGSKAATFVGTVGGNAVVIKTSWSGSAAGIQTVAQTGAPALNVKFLPTTYDTTTSLTGDNTPLNPTSGSNPNEAAIPDIAMADNEQGSSLFNGVFGGRTYAALTATPVGIVPFVWVKSNPAGLASGIQAQLANLTNMTAQLARAQWTNGSGILPLSLYTGLAADSTVNVYAAGRDPDSGTRIIAFSESGIGANTIVRQFIPGTTSPNNGLYAATTINGVSVGLGNSGESSGGGSGLAGKLNLSNLTRAYVSYLGVSDAAVLTAPNSVLTYEGVAYSPDNIKNGKYTFWSVENLMYKSTLAGVKRTFAEALATEIPNTVTIKLDDMLVGRSGDGGTVTN